MTDRAQCENLYTAFRRGAARAPAPRAPAAGAGGGARPAHSHRPQLDLDLEVRGASLCPLSSTQPHSSHLTAHRHLTQRHISGYSPGYHRSPVLSPWLHTHTHDTHTTHTRARARAHAHAHTHAPRAVVSRQRRQAADMAVQYTVIPYSARFYAPAPRCENRVRAGVTTAPRWPRSTTGPSASFS